MMPARKVCPCGAAVKALGIFHRWEQHDCVAHQANVCLVCRLIAGAERRLRVEVEHGPFVLLRESA